MRDPRMADFFLRDKAGNFITQTVFCRSMPSIAKDDPRYESPAIGNYSLLRLSMNVVYRGPF